MDTSVIPALWGLDLSVDAQMADEANIHSEGSLAVQIGDNRNVRFRVAGSGLPD